MDRIIVTIKADHYKQDYDIELPLDQKAEGLIYDIAVSMEGVDPSLWFDPEKCELRNERTGRWIDREKTLEEGGVWNGDVLRVHAKR